jgi:hypothetical protein
MYTYDQATGILTGGALETPARGYSGHGDGCNNPMLQSVPDVGPIPQGRYTISQPFDSPDHGPVAMHLTPDAGTDTFGRSGFLMHGDSLEYPGQASLGCIIMPRAIRDQVAAGSDRELEVV